MAHQARLASRTRWWSGGDACAGPVGEVATTMIHLMPRRFAPALACVVGLAVSAACSGGSPAAHPVGSGPAVVVVPSTSGDSSPSTAAPSTIAAGRRFALDPTSCTDLRASAPIVGDIDVGLSVPLTGGLAALYAPYADGFLAAVNAANAAGGINGVHLIADVQDDAGNVDATVATVESMIADGRVAAIAGVIGQANNEAIRPMLNAACLPQLWVPSGDATWADLQHFPWTTGLLVPPSVEAAALVAFVGAQRPAAATIALLTGDDAVGAATSAAFAQASVGANLAVVATQAIPPGDVSAPLLQMTAIAAQHPDVVVLAPAGAQCITALSALAAAKAATPGFDPLVYEVSSCADERFFLAAGVAAADVLTSTNLRSIDDSESSDPAVAAFISGLQAVRPGTRPTPVAETGWVAGELTVAALRAASADCPKAFTRICLMNSARNIDVAPSLFRPGLRATMNADDGYLAQSTQIIQWDIVAARFVDRGDVMRGEGGAY